jgi:S1-C subfamily serine protease
MRNIPARHAINATLQRIEANGNERWMFQDVHQGGPAFAAGIRPGDLLLECGGREVRPPNDRGLSSAKSYVPSLLPIGKSKLRLLALRGTSNGG